MLWISHDEKRKTHARTLLDHVRFPHLRRYYLLCARDMVSGFDEQTRQFVDQLYNEAILFKMGGPQWLKQKPIATLSNNHNRFTSRIPVGSASNVFTMSAKFSGVNKWAVDKPNWSENFFSNGYVLQFYLNKNNQNSFGAFLRIDSPLIPSEAFCLPINFIIYLQSNKTGQQEKIRPCKTTFRKNMSKGVPNLGVYEEFICNNSVTVTLEVHFEPLDWLDAQ